MRIGYACINTQLECRSSRTFRLASYSPERLRETLENNLACLAEIFEFNRQNGLLLFRISSDLVPFASHPVCDLPWQRDFAPKLRKIGQFIERNRMRVAMHPDQFTLLNSQDEGIVARSVNELRYHAEVLDGLGLDCSHKIQIHVGGAYGDKDMSIRRFVDQYRALPEAVAARLVIENDDRLFDLSDCLTIHEQTGIPVVFDTLHHQLNNDGTTLREGLSRALSTWKKPNGPLMVDYSTQEPGKRPGCHATSVEVPEFRRFLEKTAGIDFDVLCEVKDKESSALKAAAAARLLGRI